MKQRHIFGLEFIVVSIRTSLLVNDLSGSSFFRNCQTRSVLGIGHLDLLKSSDQLVAIHAIETAGLLLDCSWIISTAWNEF